MTSTLRHLSSCVMIVLGLVAASGCAPGPSSCAEAGCDPATEFCLLLGSDTPEPSSASCRVYPDACAEAPTCECLLEDQDPIATCEEDMGAFSIVIPGG